LGITWVGVDVEVDVGVAVGGTGVAVGGTGVAVGGTDVAVEVGTGEAADATDSVLASTVALLQTTGSATAPAVAARVLTASRRERLSTFKLHRW
jgi:hypothetical protein